jgi:hypothetical protein
MAYKRVDLTRDLILLWKDIIEKVVNQVGFMAEKKDKKEYIPGLIYSDEALALYSPPLQGTKYHCLSINPISVAAMLYPERFEKVILKQKPETFEQQVKLDTGASPTPEDTPTKKLTRMLFHEAVHEVTHFLFPDGGESNENFHSYITKLEYLCAPIYDDIRLMVKKHLKGIKKDSNELITVMKKDMNNKNTATASRKKTIKLSRKQWEKIGNYAGWLKK